MSFNRLNNLVGWIVFFIASTVYILTAEKNGSLWDCGEFVASCFKLQIPHPPGAPLFVILGRFFIVLFGDDPATAAKAVNIMSALASSFTILFLFWTITHFARKLVNPQVDSMTKGQIQTVMGAGVLGALAYTFSDSFWYSAVEGEVYALSSFFTALVFWAMLKWEHQVDKDSRTDAKDAGHFNADRWIVFIFFMMGLSIGVHLLNLLTIPAIVMIYYFKRYPVTRWGTFWAFVIGCAITGIVQKVVIQYSIGFAGKFDIWFVNSFGLPFFSGFSFFFLLVAILIVVGLRIAQQKGWYFLRLGLWCFTFMLIGYSSYLTTMIRSSADPSVDMYNVDNPMSLVGYLGREQYGDFPLLYGQVFTSNPVSYKEGDEKFQISRERKEYFSLGKDIKYEYDPADQMLFPRVWDASNDQGHADYYADFLGIGKVNDRNQMSPETGAFDRRPSFGDNIRFFIGYQNYWMYLRYFMWNFAGKQNDLQGIHPWNVRDGNWKSGISVIDNTLYGPQDKLPETLKTNKANNKLFAIPLILGLLGLFFHYYRHKRDFLVNFLLFFFTGFAIVVYLNQAGNQPRERDYAYVGSFYAFAVWIGLAIPALVSLAKEATSALLQKIIAGSSVLFIVAGVSAVIATRGDINNFLGWLMLGAFSAGVMAALVYGIRAVKNENSRIPVAIAVSLLAVPAWMAVQEWDDHDRSNKLMAPDLAKNYLESVAPNALVITFGDNDTYPLWYAQEVQGVRPDVRVINYSLLGIDWYVNQLRYKLNESAPFDVIFTPEQIEGTKRQYIRHRPIGDQEKFSNLDSVMRKWVANDDPSRMEQRFDGSYSATFPTRRFMLPVPVEKVKANGTVNASDSAIVSALNFEIPGGSLTLADLTIMAIMASNNWERPIYFTSPFNQLGFENYLRRDGMAYRLVPVENSRTNGEWAYSRMMKEFRFGNADKKGVYFDEENRRHLTNIRQAFAEVAAELAAAGQKDSAQKLLAKVDAGMLEANMPYAMPSRYSMHNNATLLMLEAAYRADDKALIKKIGDALRKDIREQNAYYQSLNQRQSDGLFMEIQYANRIESMLTQLETFLQKQGPETSPVIQSNK